MAKPIAVRVCLILTLILSMNAMESEARICPGIEPMQKRGINNGDSWNMEFHRRELLHALIKRVSPGGPDPEHHSHSPALP